WDSEGESRPLHDLNPVRLGYIAERAVLKGARVVDVGCGGGLLSEAMASAGADVVGIDLAPAVLEVARLHLLESGLKVDYRETGAEALAQTMGGEFDVVTCLEMLEHVPDPASVIRACADLLRPGGRLFVSTLNRTPRSFATAIVGAEYVMRLLPRGTHHYARFIKPSELGADLRAAGLVLEDLRGIGYNPLTRKAWLSDSVAVNYLACAVKPA
ncbi:MAG: bifunctional 2-polyprenyl-6-hydroxyphenol methylase/3-demethylubiquinol 3-O-methyltransferase UbiG, partial [Xanthomonadales bacterium]|nr:bifunctional 2-polyprenyl-6-hydroxyphenol methylase/3-demethylubiquinol 3-O-methyltransferase UbiG [Xanthomonadales bacterium]